MRVQRGGMVDVSHCVPGIQYLQAIPWISNRDWGMDTPVTRRFVCIVIPLCFPALLGIAGGILVWRYVFAIAICDHGRRFPLVVACFVLEGRK